MEQRVPWCDMVAVLYRRRALILQVLLGGLAVVTIGALLRGPIYEASATVIVTSDRAKLTVSPDLATRPTVTQVTHEDMDSEVALLKSDALIRSVLARHEQPAEPEGLVGLVRRLASLPFRLPGIVYRAMHGMPAPSPLDERVARTQRRLDVAAVGKSNLVRVAYGDSDPAWAATFVNELVAAHIARRIELNLQSEARDFFESQRRLLAARLEQAQEGLQGFYAREGVDSTPEQRAGLRARLAELGAELAQSEIQLSEAQARAEFLSGELGKYPKTIPTESRMAQNQAVQFIKPRLLELELKRTQLLTKYTPESIMVRDVDRQLAEARRLLAAEKATIAETTVGVNPAYQALEVDSVKTRARIAAVGARVAELQEQVDFARGRVAHIDTVAAEQERFEREVAAARDSYETYTKKAEEARFSSALDESRIVNIAVAEPAERPVTPKKAETVLVILLFGLMSLLVGVGAAFVRDRLEPTVKSASEAQRVSGLPILGELAP